MPDFLRFNPLNGRIVDRFISVDPSKVKGIDNLIQVSRDIVESITRFHKVDGGKVRFMTEAEKLALIAEEERAVIDAENTRILSLDNKIDEIGTMTLFKIDGKIDAIGNLQDAKLFLKKLCRYIVKFTAR